MEYPRSIDESRNFPSFPTQNYQATRWKTIRRIKLPPKTGRQGLIIIPWNPLRSNILHLLWMDKILHQLVDGFIQVYPIIIQLFTVVHGYQLQIQLVPYARARLQDDGMPLVLGPHTSASSVSLIWFNQHFAGQNMSLLYSLYQCIDLRRIYGAIMLKLPPNTVWGFFNFPIIQFFVS